MIEEGFVSRTPTLGHEKKVVAIAVRREQVDLSGQVALGIDLFIHGERCHLRIAQVFLCVCIIDAFGKRGLVTPTRPDSLAFFTKDNGGARVLAKGQNAMGGDLGISEHSQRDRTIIFCSFRIVKNRSDLLQVLRAEAKGDVFHRCFGEIS